MTSMASLFSGPNLLRGLPHSYIPFARAKFRRSSLAARAELDREKAPPPPQTPKKSTGTGFGTEGDSKKKSRRKERSSSVVRREPVARPSSLYQSSGKQSASEDKQTVNENAFLLTWLGLGLLILVEGIALAASGFLPEQWDNFFVKYLYPSFTPTVFLFVGGTVVYGVFKYIQGENMES